MKKTLAYLVGLAILFLGVNTYAGVSGDSACWGAEATELCIDSVGNIDARGDHTTSLVSSVTVTGTLGVTGAQTNTGDVTNNGATILGDAESDKLTIKGTTVIVNATASGLHLTTTTTSGYEIIAINGLNQAVTFGKRVIVSGGLEGSGVLMVTGASTLADTLAVTKQATLSNALVVSKGIEGSGALTIAGNGSVAGTMAITDKATLSNGLKVSQGIEGSGFLQILGASTLGSTLSLTDKATLSNGIKVSQGIEGSGFLQILGTSTLADRVVMSNALVVSKGVEASGNLLVAGTNNYLSGNTGIGTDATADATLEVAGRAADAFAILISSTDGSTAIFSGTLGTGADSGRITASVPFGFLQKTAAQAHSFSPPAIGYAIQCTDCTYGKYALCVSTGTAMDSWTISGSLGAGTGCY